MANKHRLTQPRRRGGHVRERARHHLVGTAGGDQKRAERNVARLQRAFGPDRRG